MCGRYVARKLRWSDYAAEPPFEEFSELRIVPKFNIAPSQQVPIVRLNRAGERQGGFVSWGLIPHWAPELPKHRPINARAETVATTPMFRDAIKRHRCLQIADGFFEWRTVDGEKQPYFIRLASDAAFAFAGLWQRWQPAGQPGAIDTCCHVTTTPNAEMSQIHTRMPVILHEPDYAAWLDPATPPDRLQAILRPLGDGELEMFPVTKAVNKPVNDGPRNVEPIGDDPPSDPLLPMA